MTVETRYMRGDQQTINGLLAYILGLTQSSTAKSKNYSTSGSQDVHLGIRVWKRDTSGTETEITSGIPVAIVGVSTAGIVSYTWDCPETQLTDTDAIVVRVYMQLGAEAWQLCDTFITEQLGATQLDAATWTVYYYGDRFYVSKPVPMTIGYFYWGTDVYNSRVEDFTWSIIVAAGVLVQII